MTDRGGVSYNDNTMGHSTIKKSKKRMVIAVAFLLLLFSVFSVVIVLNRNSSSSVDAAYYFDSSSTSEPSKDTLKAYSSYTISSAAGFKKWRWAMNKYGSDVFNGKTTTLSTNITFNSSTLERDGNGNYKTYSMPNSTSTTYHMMDQTGDMYGTLNGNGYKISGCTIVSDGSGFFDEVYGTIKNIHFYNCEYVSTTYANIDRGLIAQEVKPNASINNCIIENCLCENGANPIIIITSSVAFAPIAAKNSGSIHSCLVRGTYTTIGHTQSSLVATGNRQVYAYAMTIEGGVSSCVFDVSYSHGGWDNGSENRTNLQTGTNYYGSYASAKQNANSLDTSYWHVPPTNEYNNGNPMLRQFMSWYQVSVYPNNSSYGSTSRNYISLPSGGSYSPTISSNNLTLYGTPVTANAKTGYEFVAWSVNLSSRNIVANFDLKKYWVNVNIYNPSNQEDYVTAKMTMVYTFGGQTVTHTNMVNEAYSSSDPKTTIGSTISISNIQIIMDNPERYYVAEIRDGTGKTYNTTSMTYTVTSSEWQEINIYIRLKEYSVIFE